MTPTIGILLSQKEVAERLDVSIITIWRMRKRLTFPSRFTQWGIPNGTPTKSRRGLHPGGGKAAQL